MSALWTVEKMFRSLVQPQVLSTISANRFLAQILNMQGHASIAAKALQCLFVYFFVTQSKLMYDCIWSMTMTERRAWRLDESKYYSSLLEGQGGPRELQAGPSHLSPWWGNARTDPENHFQPLRTRKVFKVRVTKSWYGLPWELWSLRPWRDSKAIKTWPSAAGSR